MNGKEVRLQFLSIHHHHEKITVVSCNPPTFSFWLLLRSWLQLLVWEKNRRRLLFFPFLSVFFSCPEAACYDSRRPFTNIHSQRDCNAFLTALLLFTPAGLSKTAGIIIIIIIIKKNKRPSRNSNCDNKPKTHTHFLLLLSCVCRKGNGSFRKRQGQEGKKASVCFVFLKSARTRADVNFSSSFSYFKVKQILNLRAMVSVALRDRATPCELRAKHQ